MKRNLIKKNPKQTNPSLITVSPPTLSDGGANLLPLCSVKLPCISVRITDPPSSMWHGCWCTRTPLLMTSAPTPPPPPPTFLLPCLTTVMKNSCRSYWLVDRSTPPSLVDTARLPSQCNRAVTAITAAYTVSSLVSWSSWQRGGREAGGRATVAGWEVAWEKGAMTQQTGFKKRTPDLKMLSNKNRKLDFK